MRLGRTSPAPRGSGVRRLAVAGALLGALLALPVFAPAAWLAGAVASATGQRVLLADARGTVWSGDAVPVLTGGEGSRDASALPGRLSWSLRLDGLALAVSLRQPCCIAGELRLKVEPGFGRVRVTLPATAGRVGQWPAAWLAGLGTPFNTLQIGGTMSLSSGGLVAQSAAGRWRLDGNATLEIDNLASRLSTISPLGSYRLALTGGDTTQVSLSTSAGALQLNGSGQWSGRGLRFRGDARAAPGSEAALDNLLNLLGRRQGTLALLAIG
jgi:general secretion pathway protein N